MEAYTAIYSRQSRAILLLLISTTIQHMVCETFTIVPTSESACPEEICYTLNQYASDSNLSSGLDNITLELQPGTHTLDVPLSVLSILSFTMSGSGNATTTLHCADEFGFTATEFVCLRGINFINCDGHWLFRRPFIPFFHFAYQIDTIILEDSSFQTSKRLCIQSTNNVLIANSSFTRSQRGILSILLSTVTIKNSTFADNNMTSDRDVGLGVISADRSSMVVENSIFMSNRLNPGPTSTLLTSYHGTAIHTTGHNHTLMIINSTFFNNSGPSTGAVSSSLQSLAISGCTFSNNVGPTGAVYSRLQSLEISGSTFSDNIGYGDAAALSVVGERLLINQSTFHNNSNIGNYSRSSAVKASLSPRNGRIRIQGNGSIVIQGSTFIDNNSSGEVVDLSMGLDRYSTVLIERSSFIDNTVEDGAIHVTGFSYQSFTLQQSTFINNSAALGVSALSVHGDLDFVTIEQNVFANNTGRTIWHWPNYWGLRKYSAGSNLFITDNVFVNNSASFDAIILGRQTWRLTDDRINMYNVKLESNVFSLHGSSLLSFLNANVSILNSNFSHNSGRLNGGILNVRNTTVEIERSSFRFSYAEFNGGVIYASDSHVKINHSIIEHNRAGSRGGAIGIYTGNLEIEDTVIRNSSGILYGGTIIACESEVTFSYPFTVSTFTSIYDQECLQYNGASSYRTFPFIISLIMPLLIIICYS